MRHLIAAILVASAAAASAAQLDVERPISDIRMGPTASTAYGARIGSDGNDFFVSWQDQRNALTAPLNGAVYFEPRGARVDASGHVLDVPNVRLPLAGQPLWNGWNYVVADGGKWIGVSVDGTLMDGPRPHGGVIVLASNGRRILTYTVPGVDLTLRDGGMNALKTIHVAGAPSGVLAAASNGDGFAVFWSGTITQSPGAYPIMATILDHDGNEIRTFTALNFTNGYGTLVAASDGTNYLAVVKAWTANGWVLRMTGVVIGPNGAIRNVLAPFGEFPNGDVPIALAWSGSSYSLAWRWINSVGQSFVAVSPISPEGGVRDPIPIVRMESPVTELAMGSNGRQAMLLWTVAGHVWGRVFASPDDFPAGRAAAFRLGEGAFTQDAFAAATNDAGTALVVWRERVSDTDPLAVRAARIARDGSVLDPQSILIAPASCDGTAAAVASDGDGFLVGWTEADGVAVQRVTSDGHLPDALPLRISRSFTPCSQSSPAIATNRGEYLVAWNGNNDFGTTSATRAVRVSNAGARIDLFPLVLSPELPTAWTPNSVQYGYYAAPFAASDGTNFLVACTAETYVPYRGSTYASAAARVTADGTIAAAGIPLVVIPAGLAFDGKNYVAIGGAPGSGPTFTATYAARISVDGVALDGAIGGGAASLGSPLPKGAGLVPTCDANGCRTAGWTWSGNTLSLFLTRITDAQGNLAHDAPELVGTAATTQSISTLQAITTATAILLPGANPRLVYERFADEPEIGGATRIFVRTPNHSHQHAAGR